MNPADTIGEGWQPIETAPCGMDILLWCATEEGDGWLKIGWLEASFPHLLVQYDDDGHYSPHENGAWFTHWMPLPNPPASATDAPYPGRGHSTSPRTSSE